MPSVIEDYGSSENVAARAMMQKVVATIQPVIDRLVEGEYRLRPDADAAFDEVRTAIFMATGSYAREIVRVRPAAFAAEGGALGFSRTFDRALEALLGFRLLVALGNKKWQSHRRHFGYEEAIPLHVALQPRPDKLPWECFRSALFHFWGFALARQDAMLDRLVPLITLLPKAIPLGELAGRQRTWVVLVA